MTYKEGDKVRDRANVGGQVIETWGNGVKVSWNNGHTGWIDARFLSHEVKSKPPVPCKWPTAPRAMSRRRAVIASVASIHIIPDLQGRLEGKMKAALMTVAVIVAAAINLGSFVLLAGRTGDGYWTVGDFLLYLLSLGVAAMIIIGSGRAIYHT